MPTVSVVMAAKNYARFLPEAVESVFAQTHADWELVIVDDGSSDHTADVVRPFLTDRRVKFLRSDRLGQSRAKNLGLGFTTGEFVAYLDADDSWQPTKLEKQLSLFAGRPELGVVFCRRLLMDEESRVLPAKPAPPPPRGRVLPQMFTQNFVCFSSCVVRRCVFSHVGRFDPQWDLAIDYDLWLRVAQHHEFDYVDEELVLYRTGHGNLSKKLSDRVATAMSIMDRAVDRYGVRELVQGKVIAEGYASTCRTMGYVMRPSEPRTAVEWYLQALRWPSQRLHSVKGLLATGLSWLRRNRQPASAENARENR